MNFVHMTISAKWMDNLTIFQALEALTISAKWMENLTIFQALEALTKSASWMETTVAIVMKVTMKLTVSQ